MTSILIALYGGIYRLVDGRSWCPSGWNIVLYAGLPYVCWHLFGATWEALAVCSITAASILSGYKSFTFPWVKYGYDRLNLWLTDRYEPHYEKMVDWLTEHYENNNGWHTWHVFYRFVVPSLLVCLIVGEWSTPYILASSMIGTFWYKQKYPELREFLMGVVLIGGLCWL